MDSKDLRGLMEAYAEVYAPIDELYKGKHGQSETEYMAGRSDAGKRISGDEKEGPASYASRWHKGSEPTKPGKKPKNVQKLSKSEKEEIAYRKANLKKEEYVGEAVKGADTEMRKAASVERRRGDKRLSPSAGKANADKMERDIKFYDKVTKKTKPSVVGMTHEEVEIDEATAVASPAPGGRGRKNSYTKEIRTGASTKTSSKYSNVSDAKERMKTPLSKYDAPKMQLKKEEYVDVYDIILSHLLDEGYADTQQAAEAIMVNMSEEWRDSIVEGIGTKLAAAGLAGIMGAGMMNAQNSIIAKRQYPGGPLERDKTELVSKADKEKKDAEERREAELYAQGRVDQARRAGIIK